MSTERELFEAWALSRKCPPELLEAGGDYGGRGLIAGQWAAWQAARSADTSGARWLPIATAPETMSKPEVVFWRDAEGEAQHCFDYTEDGCWMEWRNHAEHVHIIGGHGVSDTPPYTHWMPLPEPPPAAPGGPAGARGSDENSPSGPSDRALNPQPEAVDHDRSAL